MTSPGVRANLKQKEIKKLVAVSYKKYLQNLKYNVIQVFLKISQISQDNTHFGVSF